MFVCVLSVWGLYLPVRFTMLANNPTRNKHGFRIFSYVYSCVIWQSLDQMITQSAAASAVVVSTFEFYFLALESRAQLDDEVRNESNTPNRITGRGDKPIVDMQICCKGDQV